MGNFGGNSASPVAPESGSPIAKNSILVAKADDKTINEMLWFINEWRSLFKSGDYAAMVELSKGIKGLLKAWYSQPDNSLMYALGNAFSNRYPDEKIDTDIILVISCMISNWETYEETRDPEEYDIVTHNAEMLDGILITLWQVLMSQPMPIFIYRGKKVVDVQKILLGKDTSVLSDDVIDINIGSGEIGLKAVPEKKTSSPIFFRRPIETSMHPYWQEREWRWREPNTSVLEKPRRLYPPRRKSIKRIYNTLQEANPGVKENSGADYVRDAMMAFYYIEPYNIYSLFLRSNGLHAEFYQIFRELPEDLIVDMFNYCGDEFVKRTPKMSKIESCLIPRFIGMTWYLLTEWHPDPYFSLKLADPALKVILTGLSFIDSSPELPFTPQLGDRIKNIFFEENDQEIMEWLRKKYPVMFKEMVTDAQNPSSPLAQSSIFRGCSSSPAANERDGFDSKSYYWDGGYWRSKFFPRLVLGSWEDILLKPGTYNEMVNHVAIRVSGYSIYVFDSHKYCVSYIREAQQRKEIPLSDNTQVFIDLHSDDIFGFTPQSLENIPTNELWAYCEGSLKSTSFMHVLAGGCLTRQWRVFDAATHNREQSWINGALRGKSGALAYVGNNYFSKQPMGSLSRYPLGSIVEYSENTFTSYFSGSGRPKNTSVIINIEADASPESDVYLEFLKRIKTDGISPCAVMLCTTPPDFGWVRTCRELAQNIPSLFSAVSSPVEGVGCMVQNRLTLSRYPLSVSSPVRKEERQVWYNTVKLGIELNQPGNYLMALGLLGKLLEDDPHDIIAADYYFGIARKKEKLFREVFENIEEMIGIPGFFSPVAHYVRASLNFDKGRFKECLADMNEAIRLSRGAENRTRYIFEKIIYLDRMMNKNKLYLSGVSLGQEIEDSLDEMLKYNGRLLRYDRREWVVLSRIILADTLNRQGRYPEAKSEIDIALSPEHTSGMMKGGPAVSRYFARGLHLRASLILLSIEELLFKEELKWILGRTIVQENVIKFNSLFEQAANDIRLADMTDRSYVDGINHMAIEQLSLKTRVISRNNFDNAFAGADIVNLYKAIALALRKNERRRFNLEELKRFNAELDAKHPDIVNLRLNGVIVPVNDMYNTFFYQGMRFIAIKP